MKVFLGLLVVLFLTLGAGTAIVSAQTARQDLKGDVAVSRSNLTEAELDALVDIVKEQMEADERDRKHDLALERMKKMLEDDAQLKTDLMNE